MCCFYNNTIGTLHLTYMFVTSAVGRGVTYKSDRVWKEAIVASGKLLSLLLIRGAYENHDILSG